MAGTEKSWMILQYAGIQEYDFPYLLTLIPMLTKLAIDCTFQKSSATQREEKEELEIINDFTTPMPQCHETGIP